MNKDNELIFEAYNGTRACAWCEKELYGKTNPEHTHGVCKRHALAQMEEMLKFASTPMQKKQIEDDMIKVRNRLDDTYCPDLSPEKENKQNTYKDNSKSLEQKTLEDEKKSVQ